MNWIPIIHAAATWTMVGVILTVQLVVYPQFLRVGPSEFAAYHAQHMRRITWVVGPPMIVEALTAVILLVMTDAAGLSVVGVALLSAIWIDTWAAAVPLHNRLSNGPDTDVAVRLVRANLRRTVLWGARGVVAALLLAG